MSKEDCTTYDSCAGCTSATTTATTSTSATAGASAALQTFGCCAFSLVASRLWLTSQLNGNLSFEDILAREIVDRLLSIGGRLQVDKGISNRAAGARIDRNRCRFAGS